MSYVIKHTPTGLFYCGGGRGDVKTIPFVSMGKEYYHRSSFGDIAFAKRYRRAGTAKAVISGATWLDLPVGINERGRNPQAKPEDLEVVEV